MSLHKYGKPRGFPKLINKEMAKKEINIAEKLIPETEEYYKKMEGVLDHFSDHDLLLSTDFVTVGNESGLVDALGIEYNCPHSIRVTNITIEQLLDNGFKFVRKYIEALTTVESGESKGHGPTTLDVDTKQPAVTYHGSILRHSTENIFCEVQFIYQLEYGKDVDTGAPLVKYLISASFVYKTAAEELFLKDLIDNKFKYIRQKKGEGQGELHIVVASTRGLALSRFFLDPITIDFDTHYNEDFKEVSDVIVEGLSVDKSKGIVLLHGIKGSGKTSYIKWLTAHEEIKKNFIFVPADLTHKLATPGFVELLIQHPNSIVIIEDGENVLKQRSGGDNGAVSAILNLGDGLLSDCLSTQFVITFNTDLKNVDDALTRKGRLIAGYEFSELTVDRVEKILGYPGKAMTLADAINHDSKYGKQNRVEKKTVGFS